MSPSLALTRFAATLTGKPQDSHANALDVLRRQLRRIIPRGDVRVTVRPIYSLESFELRMRYAKGGTYHAAGWSPARTTAGGTPYRSMSTAPRELIEHLEAIGGTAGPVSVELPERVAQQLCPAIAAGGQHFRRGYVRRVRVSAGDVHELVLTQPSGDDEAIILDDLTPERWDEAINRMVALASAPSITTPTRRRAQLSVVRA